MWSTARRVPPRRTSSPCKDIQRQLDRAHRRMPGAFGSGQHCSFDTSPARTWGYNDPPFEPYEPHRERRALRNIAGSARPAEEGSHVSHRYVFSLGLMREPRVIEMRYERAHANSGRKPR